MNCPNCDMPVKHGSLCVNCGVDVVLLTKTLKLSDCLYNKGLADAKAGNYSGAIENLNKSVSYNKNNTLARNLLGLVYYEYGRVADALKAWIISASIDKEDNPAARYIGLVQDDARTFERYGEAIENYNNALSYLRQKSEDMAIIQLKKAIELNPNFIDAQNLLALCFLILKDKERATQAVDKVLSLDRNNPIAMNYYKEIHLGRSRNDISRREQRGPQSERQAAPSAPYLYAKPKKSLISAFHLASVLLFIVGVVCTFAYFSILVIPPMIEEQKTEIDTLNKTVESMTVENESALKEKDEAYEALQSQVQELANEKDELSLQFVRQEKIQKVNTAYNFMRENRLEEAADILYPLDITGLPVDTVELYDSMVTTSVYPKVTQQLYNNGVSSYNAKEYNDAKYSLEKAMRFVTADDNTSRANIIYQLGLTAQALESFDEAIEYYKDIVENYPDSKNKNNAQTRLNTLHEQQGGA